MKEKFSKLKIQFKISFLQISKKVRADSVDSISSHIAFFIIISLIPFSLLVLSLLNTINVNGTSIINYVSEFLPQEVKNFILPILPKETDVFAIMSFAAITSTFTSSVAMKALMKGLNRIFESKHERGFIVTRLISVLYTLLFALVLVISSIILLFGNFIFEFLKSHLGFSFLIIIDNLKSLFAFILLVVFFTLSYYFIPFKIKYKLKNCAIGAIFAAAGWVLFTFFFSIYIESFPRYNMLYGSFSTLIIFMLWLYFCIYILLIGGEISFFLEKRKTLFY